MTWQNSTFEEEALLFLSRSEYEKRSVEGDLCALSIKWTTTRDDLPSFKTHSIPKTARLSWDTGYKSRRRESHVDLNKGSIWSKTIYVFPATSFGMLSLYIRSHNTLSWRQKEERLGRRHRHSFLRDALLMSLAYPLIYLCSLHVTRAWKWLLDASFYSFSFCFGITVFLMLLELRWLCRQRLFYFIWNSSDLFFYHIASLCLLHVLSSCLTRCVTCILFIVFVRLEDCLLSSQVMSMMSPVKPDDSRMILMSGDLNKKC
jgi:hypothetical protein